MNALFVPRAALLRRLVPLPALYPWSHILTGTQGQDPGFDPLQFMIDTAHSLGLEFHALAEPPCG